MHQLAPRPSITASAAQAGRSRFLLLVLLASQALAAMDTSIANVAAPVIERDLHAGGSVLQAIVAGYVLAYAVLLIAGARTGDHFGPRPVFAAGMLIFTLSSLACGLSQTGTEMILARVAQGVGAAFFVPQILSIIQRLYEGEERARILGYYSAILAVGVAAGQIIGGVVIAQDLFGWGWRFAFLMNLPVGLILTLGSRIIPSSLRPADRAQLDLFGLSVLVPSTALIVAPLILIRETDLSPALQLALLLGSVGIWILWRIEKGIKSHGKVPLVDVDLVTAAGVRSSLFIIAVGFVSYGGLLFSTSLFVQNAIGLSPVGSGLVFCCYALGFGCANLGWPKLLPKQYVPAMIAVALAVLAASQAALAATVYYAGWLPLAHVVLLLVSGSAHGLAFGPTVSFASARISPHAAGLLSGLVTTMVQVAIVLGIAALGSVYLWRVSGGLPMEGLALTSLGCAFLACSALIPAALNFARSRVERL